MGGFLGGLWRSVIWENYKYSDVRVPFLRGKREILVPTFMSRETREYHFTKDSPINHAATTYMITYVGSWGQIPGTPPRKEADTSG